MQVHDQTAVRAIGSKAAAIADLADQVRHAKEQGNDFVSLAADFAKRLTELYFPQRSTIHNGLDIEIGGRIDDQTGEVTVIVRTVRVAGGV